MPASARAKTVVHYAPSLDDEDRGVYIDDGPGASVLEVDIVATHTSGHVRVRANRGSIAAGAGCKRRAARVVRCPFDFSLQAELGAGDDRIVFRTKPPTWAVPFAQGGPGDDRIVSSGSGRGYLWGGTGRDVIRGGALHDVLAGGRGRDELHGGGGSDELWGEGFRGPFKDDVLDGGAGFDTGLWVEHGRPVRVDLARGVARSGRERDRLTSIEAAEGGRGDDVLLGDGAHNRVVGNEGRDRLVGRGGDDVLSGGIGADAADGSLDRLDCGRGDDAVENPWLDPLPRDCELLGSNGAHEFGWPFHAQPRPAGKRRVLVESNCDPTPGHCERQVMLRAHGRTIGRSELVRIRSGARRWIPVRLARPLPRHGLVKVVVSLGVGKDAGYYENDQFVWRIRR